MHNRKQKRRCRSILWNLTPTIKIEKISSKSNISVLFGQQKVSKKLSSGAIVAEVGTVSLRKQFKRNDSSFKRQQHYGEKQSSETVIVSSAESLFEKTIEIFGEKTAFVCRIRGLAYVDKFSKNFLWQLRIFSKKGWKMQKLKFLRTIQSPILVFDGEVLLKIWFLKHTSTSKI